jgi:hypothetical protein
VRWCLAVGGPDFCKWCAVATRAFHVMVLRRSPTFIGANLPLGDEEKPPL